MVANDAEFDQILKDAGEKAVIVDFTASWCGPCQMIGPKFAALADEHSGSDKIIFIKVDVDECEDTAARCKIEAMPTFKVFKNNNKFYSIILSLKQLKNSKFVFKIKNKFLNIKNTKWQKKTEKYHK